MLLLIDNYDSFTYNLVQYFLELGQMVRVARNDELSLRDIAKLNPDYLVISPGPGAPVGAGLSLAIINEYKGQIPILGVCLGHQAIGQVFGAKVVHAQKIMHGKTSLIEHTQVGLFRRCPQPMEVARYHSLVIDPRSIPSCLEVTAWTQEASQGHQEVMAIAHKKLPLLGVQFHPESIASQAGHVLLGNFLKNN